MNGSVPLSKAAPRQLLINWWQAGKIARLDCTSFSCVVADTGLPFTPIIAAVDLATGRFRMLPPAPANAAKLKIGRSYGVHVVLRNALAEPVDDMRFTIEAV